MELEQSKLYDILIECLRKDKRGPETAVISSLSDQDWHNLLALAAMQRVTSLLWHRFKQKGLDKVVPDAAVATFHAAFSRNTMNNMRLNGELRLRSSRNRGAGLLRWFAPLLLPYCLRPLRQRFGLRCLRRWSGHDIVLSDIQGLFFQRAE